LALEGGEESERGESVTGGAGGRVEIC